MHLDVATLFMSLPSEHARGSSGKLISLPTTSWLNEISSHVLWTFGSGSGNAMAADGRRWTSVCQPSFSAHSAVIHSAHFLLFVFLSFFPGSGDRCVSISCFMLLILSFGRYLWGTGRQSGVDSFLFCYIALSCASGQSGVTWLIKREVFQWISV